MVVTFSSGMLFSPSRRMFSASTDRNNEPIFAHRFTGPQSRLCAFLAVAARASVIQHSLADLVRKLERFGRSLPAISVEIFEELSTLQLPGGRVDLELNFEIFLNKTAIFLLMCYCNIR